MKKNAQHCIKNSRERCAKSIHPAFLETQKQRKTSGSISVENVEQFKKIKHDTELLKCKDCSLDGSGKFAKFSVMFEKNPFKSYILRITEKSLVVIKQCKRNSCNVHQYAHKNDETNETNRFCRLEGKKQPPFFFSVLANVMLSTEKRLQSRYCKNYFERCHSIR